MIQPPQLWIIAGPNGAGKSTLADVYFRSKLPLINPDNNIPFQKSNLCRKLMETSVFHTFSADYFPDSL